MQTAEVVRNRQRPIDSAVDVGCDFANLVFLRREAAVRHPAPDRGLPDQPHRRTGREAFALQNGARADGTLRRSERQPRSGDRRFSLRDRLGLVWFGVRDVGCRTGRRTKRELGPRQCRNRRLLVIQVTETLPSRVQLDDVIACRTRRAKASHCRSARRCRRHEAQLLVVPVHNPGAFHRSPTESRHLQLDRSSHGT